MKQEAEWKSFTTGILKNEFLFFNEQKKRDKRQRMENENRDKTNETYNYFPFVAGELINKHREEIASQMKKEM